jgi:AraC-like DNA-binding protein
MILLPSCFHTSSIERIGILSRQLLHINESRYYTDLGVDYILTSLLIEFTEQAIAQSSDESNHGIPPENLSKILEWIRVHLTWNISLKQVAHEFNYTREYLARYFKKHMGMSMLEYIHNMKMAKARELLCQSDLSIKEIAAALGFQDDKYFLRLFKRHEKMTPGEYRKAYYRIHMNNS